MKTTTRQKNLASSSTGDKQKRRSGTGKNTEQKKQGDRKKERKGGIDFGDASPRQERAGRQGRQKKYGSQSGSSEYGARGNEKSSSREKFSQGFTRGDKRDSKGANKEKSSLFGKRQGEQIADKSSLKQKLPLSQENNNEEFYEEVIVYDAAPKAIFTEENISAFNAINDATRQNIANSDENPTENLRTFKPEILAPAGDTQSFLAAMAAGADACYVGLKHFSARAGADNFSSTELSRMVNLAAKYDRKINIAFNSLVKPNDLVAAGRLMKRLARDVKPNAIIIQDVGLIDIARQAGFEGEVHLSTLANLTHPKALESAALLGANRVILPREINIDEIKTISETCPDSLSLELFVHGALCYCVSGRCYWSSYMGGKSGLRGRCVQPCRRVYKQRSNQGRYFSSQDLSLDVLVKSLLNIPKLDCWKIEGRKKGPHYVYHTVMAYKLLRDEGSAAKKEAEALLQMALGRPSTHGIFLPQNPQEITIPRESTGSGLLVGKIQFDVVEEDEKEKQKKKGKGKDKNNKTTRQNISAPYFKPRIPLLTKDLLRIGYEDDAWYNTLPVTRGVPKNGTYNLRLQRHKTPKAGTPVYLIDRREPDLLKELKKWEEKLQKTSATKSSDVDFVPHLPKPCGTKRVLNIRVRANLPQGKETKAARSSLTGLWMTPSTVRAVSKTLAPRISWWLPPVIWTNEEAMWQRTIHEAIMSGSTHFVLNEPWQIGFFTKYAAYKSQFIQPELQTLAHGSDQQDVRKGRPNSPSHKVKVPRGGKSNADHNRAFTLIAGPFCNISNAATIALMKNMGFHAAIVSPELSKQDFLLLPRQSCLPLGFVVEGFWPMGISRHEPQYLKNNTTFESPKGEQFWTRKYGQNTWIYPSWPMDFSSHRTELEHAGYSFFATLEEFCPEKQERDSNEFNWNVPLL